MGVEQDAPRPTQGNGFSDAVTVAFADGAAELYGVARLGLSDIHQPEIRGEADVPHGAEVRRQRKARKAR